MDDHPEVVFSYSWNQFDRVDYDVLGLVPGEHNGLRL
jgi:hypothetical protein